MRTLILGVALMMGFFGVVYSQQVDIPEPTFMQFPGVQAYQIRFTGRDPFLASTASLKSSQIVISELEFHGVLKMGSTTMAIFNWRGNGSARFVLKQRKLYSEVGDAVDGVVGDITDTEVVLSQGSLKIPFPREQRRP
jgi:hypothetical protein